MSTYGGRNNERFQGARRIRDMLDHRIAISTGQLLCNLWAHFLHAVFGQVLNMFAQVPIEMCQKFAVWLRVQGGWVKVLWGTCSAGRGVM